MDIPILLFHKIKMPISPNPKIELITPELLTPGELAGMLRISKAGVYRLIEKRQIHFYKIMGSLRFDKNDVLLYLEQSGIEPIGLKHYGGQKN